MVIENWTVHSAIEDTGTIRLAAGKPVPIKIEYQGSGGATARLLWSSPSQSREIVPAARLTTPDRKERSLRGEYHAGGPRSLGSPPCLPDVALRVLRDR